MKLLYLNLIENDFIEDKEIYFSKDFDFKIVNTSIKFSRNNTQKSKDNISIKAFIGENGCGKTTLLNRLCTLNFNGIAIFKEEYNDKFYLMQQGCMIVPDSNFIYLDKVDFKRLFFINYNNIFNPFQVAQRVNNEYKFLWKKENYLNIIDISTDYEYLITAESDKTKYTSNEVKNTLSLFMNDLNKEDENKILYKEIKTPDLFFVENVKLLKLKENEQKKKNIFLYQFLADLTYILLYNSFIKNANIEEFFIKEYDKVLQIINIYEKIYEFDRKTTEDIKKEIHTLIPEIYTVEFERVFSTNINKTINIIYAFKTLIEKSNLHTSLNDPVLIFNIEDNGIFIEKFLENTKQNSIKEHFFNYYYGYPYSSGELAIITMFSRLLVKSKELSSDIKDICLFLDEPEIFAHPEWQRKFIISLRKGLQILFPNKSIQVFITSHSPYLISDIPKENVFFMERIGEKTYFKDPEGLENTFAANIHTLARNGFFMTLTIGEFAKSKIEEVIEIINTRKYHENKEYCDYIISIVGEPLIKNKLLSMIDEQESIQDKIKRKKQELEELENLQNEKNINSLKSKRFDNDKN